MFSFVTKVDYLSLDKNLKATFTRLLRYLQDASLLQSANSGLPFEYFYERNRAWIITNWQVEVQRSPHWSEDITVKTAPAGFHGMIGERGFLIDDSFGNTIVRANSRWAYMDTENRRPVRFPPDVISQYGEIWPLPLERNFKIEDYSAFELTGQKEYIVTRDDIDSNAHVNNCRYIEWAFSEIPDDTFYNCSVTVMNAAFKRECKRGDKILLETFINPENPLIYVTRITNLTLGAAASEVYSIWKAGV